MNIGHMIGAAGRLGMKIVTEATTSRTLAFGDMTGRTISFTNAARATLTIPANSTDPLPLSIPVGIYHAQGGGGVDIVAATGVTVTDLRLPRTRGEGAFVCLIQISLDEWVITQDGLTDGIMGYEFSATNHYATSGLTPIGDTDAQSFYVQFLARVGGLTTNRGLGGAVPGGGGSGWYIRLHSSGDFRFQFYDSTAALQALSASQDLAHYGRWNLYTCQYIESSKTVNIYSGGAIIATSTYPNSYKAPATETLKLGTSVYDAAGGTRVAAMGGAQNYEATDEELLDQWSEVQRTRKFVPLDASHHYWDLSRVLTAPSTVSDQTSGTAADLSEVGTVSDPLEVHWG